MRSIRTIVIGVGLFIVVAAAFAAFSASTGATNTVTRARLERSLEKSYANRYVALSKILGHPGVTVASLDAHAICDKGGPTVADKGPGGDWVCQIAYVDPNVPNPDGTAKVELNVHANDCYTAVGSTKLVGPLNITDTNGKTVVNPANEFDGCFDPNSPGDPDGTLVIVNPTPLPGAKKVSSPLTLPVGHVTLDTQRRLALPLTCAAGGPDCAGSLDIALMGKSIAKRTFTVPAGTLTTIKVPLSSQQARDGGMVTLTPTMDASSVFPS